MIIIRVMGGLGNQMFQYAFARNLSIKTKQIVRLDISSYSLESNRQYELHKFNILEQYATNKDLEQYNIYPGILGELCLKIRKYTFGGKRIKFETEFENPPAMSSNLDGLYLHGYWQNEQYFNDIRHLLLDEFTLKQAPSKSFLKILKEINSRENPVSVHIRRGDYVTNPKAKAFHGNCSIQFYLDGINRIHSRFSDAFYYLFSDDPEWVKENIHIPYTFKIVSEVSSRKPEEDIILMTNCKHHVIANSSFSWWGAWLCKNKEKIVIAPRYWFKNIESAKTGIIPPEWEIL